MKTFSVNSKLLRAFFGLALLIGLVLYFDPRKVFISLISLDVFWVIAAAVLIVCASMLGAVNTYLLVNLEGTLNFVSFLPLFWLSWAVGLIFPGQVGDMASLGLQLRRRGINLSKTIGRSLVDKIISLILMTALALWGISHMPLAFTISVKWLFLLLVLMVIVFWSIKHLFSRTALGKIKIVNFVLNTMHEMLYVMKCYPKRIAVNLMLTTIKISLTGIYYWYIFHALGYAEIDPRHVIALVAVSSLVAYIPISFNGIGTAEIAGVLLFGTLGLKEADVLTAYLVLRLMMILIAWVPAGLWLFFRRKDGTEPTAKVF